MGRQIQVGFYFQGKKKTKTWHSSVQLPKQSTVIGIKTESLPLPQLAV